MTLSFISVRNSSTSSCGDFVIGHSDMMFRTTKWPLTSCFVSANKSFNIACRLATNLACNSFGTCSGSAESPNANRIAAPHHPDRDGRWRHAGAGKGQPEACAVAVGWVLIDTGAWLRRRRPRRRFQPRTHVAAHARARPHGRRCFSPSRRARSKPPRSRQPARQGRPHIRRPRWPRCPCARLAMKRVSPGRRMTIAPA